MIINTAAHQRARAFAMMLRRVTRVECYAEMSAQMLYGGVDMCVMRARGNVLMSARMMRESARVCEVITTCHVRWMRAALSALFEVTTPDRHHCVTQALPLMMIAMLRYQRALRCRARRRVMRVKMFKF